MRSGSLTPGLGPGRRDGGPGEVASPSTTGPAHVRSRKEKYGVLHQRDCRFGDDTAQETGTHHVLSSSCSPRPGDIRFVPPAQGLRLRSGMIPDEQPAIEDVFCAAGTDLVNVLPPLFFLRRPKKGEPTGRANRNTHGRAGGGWMAIFRVPSAKAITRAWAVGVLPCEVDGWSCHAPRWPAGSGKGLSRFPLVTLLCYGRTSSEGRVAVAERQDQGAGNVPSSARF